MTGAYFGHFMPVLDGRLTCHERGAPAGPLLDEFEEIAPLPVVKQSEPRVVEDEEIGLGECSHHLPGGAVRARQHELVAQEARQSDVAHGVALATGVLSQGTGQLRFSSSGRTDDQ